jgi:zinc transport system substrate-binding protein
MEPWAEDLVAGAAGKGLRVVEAGTLVELRAGEADGDHDHHHDHKGTGNKKTDHKKTQSLDHGNVDPHIWLEFTNAAKIALGMAQAFAEKDPKNGEVYKARAQAYGDSLRELDQRYAQTLKTCRHRTIIYGGHFAFGYAAKRYQLKHVSPYKGFSPNAEPSPKDVAQLTRRMKKEGHSHIFFEEGVEPKVARVISGETGAKMLLLHGAHNLGKKELDDKVTYLSLMNDNLQRLQEGLQCR